LKKIGLASFSGVVATTLRATPRESADHSMPTDGNRPSAWPARSAENIVFPPQAAAVVDVTKAPYFCDNTGRQDCTTALIRALDDILRPTLLAQQALVAEMEADPRSDYRHPLSMENRKEKGRVLAIFPARLSPSKILYFPNGTYLVSDTVCYSFPDLHNSERNELARQVIIRGQSEGKTIIRLKDDCAGFGAGANKPVFSFNRKTTSTVAMANFFENLTIITGAGNPGASGLRFFSNNTGAVRHVSVISGDPGLAGSVGILCDRSNLSCSFLQHVRVEGFDYGVQVLPHKMNVVIEHLELSGQKKGGVLVDQTPVAIRGLRSRNVVPALLLTDPAAHVALVDSDLRAENGTPGNTSAIEQVHGVLFARNVQTSGYAAAVGKLGETLFAGPRIEEYVSHGVYSALPDGSNKSLNLPVEETPQPAWESDPARWVSVNEYGARGDGEADDTAAIQAALNSGKPVVYFQPGRYKLDGQIRVPRTVTRINFMFCDLVAGQRLRAMDGRGTFLVDEFSEEPLLMEDLFAFEDYRGQQYFVEHASTRTLVLSDLHTQIGAMYTNSVEGGKVFLENVACTDEFSPAPNCHRFRGQRVWARQLNPERANPEVLNEGSQLWVFGFKTEGPGTGFHTSRRGATEVLGGVINFGGTTIPFLTNEDSRVSISCAARSRGAEVFTRFAVEKHGGQEKVFLSEAFPRRMLFMGSGTREYHSHALLYSVPLYVSDPR